ncbi:MAG: 16S rRNA (uracil(1498)-N(3))-methyltransferase, partial [Gammaproteobacteria bacterium]|nr:16S rRNA (uracil(1498)-N(3))-methyltransferase [Gammaproteobacteria bacterium]
MRIPRIYQNITLHTGIETYLDSGAATHIVRVLRLKPGAPLVIFNGQGGEYEATLIHADKHEATIHVGKHSPDELESPLDVTLIQGISRGERMDYTIQKAVELGVNRIVPVISKRTVVKLDATRSSKRQAHWQAIVNSACEQCGRNRVPVVSDIIKLEQYLSTASEGLKLILDHRANTSLISQKKENTISLLIGPEGGLAPEEQELAKRAGYTGLRLGPRILRTETAALAA